MKICPKCKELMLYFWKLKQHGCTACGYQMTTKKKPRGDVLETVETGVPPQ